MRLINEAKIAAGILLCFGYLAFAQGAAPHGVNRGNEVRLVAERTIEAIRNKDTSFLSQLVDPKGIGLGFDQDAISAAQFKKELAEKRGAFCVLFDYPCKGGGVVASPTGSSLRHLVIGQALSIQTVTQTTENKSEIVSAAVKKADNPNETLFTLYFRHVGNNWRLAQIEYQ